MWLRRRLVQGPQGEVRPGPPRHRPQAPAGALVAGHEVEVRAQLHGDRKLGWLGAGVLRDRRRRRHRVAEVRLCRLRLGPLVVWLLPPNGKQVPNEHRTRRHRRQGQGELHGFPARHAEGGGAGQGQAGARRRLLRGLLRRHEQPLGEGVRHDELPLVRGLPESRLLSCLCHMTILGLRRPSPRGLPNVQGNQCIAGTAAEAAGT
mmetsp:Transcript_10958/g.22312  ORF Transcript_10958/g.22312 Transcript_10958/m.22312 type:complete len:205 (+) Transcript_10958:303-917(+)